MRALRTSLQHHRKTRNGAPAALRVSSMPALSIRQPCCTVLMTRIITVDTNKQASTRSNSALSLHAQSLHTHMYAVQRSPTTHTAQAPSHHHHHHISPIFPYAAACTCTRNPIHNDYATTHLHHLHVPTSCRRTRTSTDDEASPDSRLLPPSPKKAKHFHSRPAAGAVCQKGKSKLVVPT